MKSKQCCRLLALGVAFLGAFASRAQTPASLARTATAVPRLVQFNGVVNEAVGKPVAGVTFALYNDQEGGVAIWTETQNVPLDETGHYTAMLGAMTNGGLPMDLFAKGQALWLGVRPEMLPEQPRVMLLSVPYALKAADSDTVGGLPASAFVRALPSGAPASAAAAAATPDVTGSGTKSYVPLWSTATKLGSSVLYQSGTGGTAKVGINTTAPTSTLDVNGNLVATSVSAPTVTATSLTTGSASATTLTTGSAAAASLTLNGDTPLQSAPRMFTTAFFPGGLTSQWTAGEIVPDQAIAITRVIATAKSPGTGFCSTPVLSVSDPGSGQAVENFSPPFDSGPESLNYAAGSAIYFSVQTPAYCTNGSTSPADTNVIVEYSMGPGAANNCGNSFGMQNCGNAGLAVCTNTSFDPNNCGNCAHVCSGGQVCVLGACGAPRRRPRRPCVTNHDRRLQMERGLDAVLGDFTLGACCDAAGRGREGVTRARRRRHYTPAGGRHPE